MKKITIILFLLIASISSLAQIDIKVEDLKGKIISNFQVMVFGTKSSISFPVAQMQSLLSCIPDSIIDIRISLDKKREIYFRGIMKKYLSNSEKLQFKIDKDISNRCTQTILNDISLIYIGNRELNDCQKFQSLTIFEKQ